MATALNIVKPALQLILVQASEADLEADEYADTIDALNYMMEALEAEGIHLGWTTVSSVGDTVTVPPGAIRGIYYNLAIEVAPQFDAEIPPTLYKIAQDGMSILRKLGTVTRRMRFPSTLPTGSGNQSSVMDSRYYSGDDLYATLYGVKDPDSVEAFTVDWEDLMAKTGDTISTSSWTVDAGVVVDSDTNTTLTATAILSSGNEGSTCTAVNRIVTAGSKTYDRTYLIDIRDI